MSVNKKVKNATPLVYEGIRFRSKLEVYCYKKLKENKLYAEYEKHKFVLLEPFKYNGESIRQMTYTPDFVGTGFVIECKGVCNDAFPLRYKLFKYYLFKNNISYDLYLPRNQKDVDKVIEKIRTK